MNPVNNRFSLARPNSDNRAYHTSDYVRSIQHSPSSYPSGCTKGQQSVFLPELRLSLVRDYVDRLKNSLPKSQFGRRERKIYSQHLALSAAIFLPCCSPAKHETLQW